MELNHISPSPAPPTPTSHEDDDCRTDVSSLAIDSVTLAFCLIGLVGNGAIRCLLLFTVRRNSITVYIIELVSANFIFLLFTGIFSALYIVENVSCSTIVTLNPKTISLLSLLFYNTGLYILTAISIRSCVKSCVSIPCPLRYCCCDPCCMSAMVCDLLWGLSIAVFAAVICQCLWREHEHCQIVLISMYTINLIFAGLMFISSIVLPIKLLCCSQQCQPRRDIAIFLTVLLFILPALPLSICSFLQQFGYIIVPSQVVSLLACINSSINPFIYFLVGSYQKECFLLSPQKALQRVFEKEEGNK